MKLFDYLKRAAGEASLHSALGLWRQKISDAVDQLIEGGAAGGVFNWAATNQAWVIPFTSSSDITDAAITHTSKTGRVRVMLEVTGLYGEGGSDVSASLLFDSQQVQKPVLSVLPNEPTSIAGTSGWWVLDVDDQPHTYMARIANGGAGIFTIDPTDDFSHFVILSVEDVAA